MFLWAITDDRRLSKAYRSAFEEPANELFLSVASVWEILIKCGLDKLPLPRPAARYIEGQMETNRIATLGMRAKHFAELEKLPALHRDPFDRMIAAQAIAEGMPLMTADRALRKYGVKTL